VIAHAERVRAARVVPFAFEAPKAAVPLERDVARFPYVPSDPRKRDERCYEAYNIQVSSLMKRLAATGSRTIVIAVSGGLDSTHALIVAARTMDRLRRPRGDILAYSMPGFATSERTRGNALRLMQALGVTAGEIDIRPSCMQMFKDIGHPFARGVEQYDVTFENVQAGERTSHVFRLANLHNGIVLGTGDLSELALGWTTYGVGDHMSHYGINGSVPKTLIRHLIGWVIETGQFDAPVRETLESVLSTEISPELVPGKSGADKGPAQSTEAAIGPYELQDFNLYYLSRYGFRPSRVAFLALHAWADAKRGTWPQGIAENERHAYDLATIRKWLEVFCFRFFQLSQFKRSCLPNGPKVGSGGSLSPRGDWRAPSDAEADVWLEELRQNVPEA
jgi:NAD+ synthase (glutamine-hydrolysing)